MCSRNPEAALECYLKASKFLKAYQLVRFPLLLS